MTDREHERVVRPIEDGVATDLRGELTYAGYLQLPTLLSAQQPISDHHDEMLFIVQHQVTELWLKQLIHELRSAIDLVTHDDLSPALKRLARVKAIQRQMFEQWSVLETLTPVEYVQFRDVLGRASGFQSPQYRTVEFLLGNKNAQMLAVFDHDPVLHDALQADLEAPSLYDAFLHFLARRGHDIPARVLDRDVSQPYAADPGVTEALRRIYASPHEHWDAYEMCEELVDVEESFQLWRFRHLKTVERIIGFKRGTGGSSGVHFLQKALELTFFPELLDVRTRL
ncbi:tryptophan 2,3-dioxygenase [Aeromicrobium wangtongii]|uniref:Tryptophan 2,3-dioxygenase n=1 Tax=Aeromicrobium wangtongii TaxID=2969247 RepID=A0ABY5MAU6_9ACTN|nr:tryptophan 2,3-dioxygenase [Aeromicrobium wangtongii]MCD9196756.1 tryptophan 2,3-dioxygenase [Aeromicrobium wangtongii]MCL3817724.1 tryptophan 2,3-dioxygenase [Aeromicrobium wangtongii]UUP14266.1 tryptophan 2,3-dioxygenase [Aeromicrobium wangtongii]